MTGATPRPWRVARSDGREIIADDGGQILSVAYVQCHLMRASPESEARANAALIVRAVNAHDDLVALVREITEQRNANTRAMAKASPSWVADARALLARIKADSADLP